MTETTLLGLEDQANGANNNTWGDIADQNFLILEQAVADVLAIVTTGGTTVLTQSQNRYPVIYIQGALTSNAIIEVETHKKGWWLINQTTGNYSVTVKTAAGTGKVIPRRAALRLICDGTNVEYIRPQAIPHAVAGGTADVMTATYVPAFLTAEMQDGLIITAEAVGANTVTTPTLNIDGIGANTIKKAGVQALAVGDIPRAGYKMLLMYAAAGHWELLNPATGSAAASDTAPGTVELATTAEVLAGTDTGRAVTPGALAALWKKGSDVASAATLTLGDGGMFHVTGTTTITDIDFSTPKDGRVAILRFDDVLTITHNGSTLKLPNAEDILTATGDYAIVVQDNDDLVEMVAYHRKTGLPLRQNWILASKNADETITASTTLQNDDDLRFTPAASTTYAFRIRAQYDTDAAADFKFGIDGPTSPTRFRASYRVTKPDGAIVDGNLTAYETSGISITSGSGNGGFVEINGILTNGSNTQALRFQWAQNTSDPGNTTVRAGSELEYREVG